jgi:hypothetical protein
VSPADPDDPFSDAADPYLPDPKLNRRDLAKLLALPVLAAPLISSCAHLPLGCTPSPENTRNCRHRFCRYYGG